MSDAETSARLRRGGLYLSREVCDRYFAGLEGVILLRRERDLVIMPVRHAAAGGYILKLRNGAGDRVVVAPDFFRSQDIDDDVEIVTPVVWETARSALVAPGLFPAN